MPTYDYICLACKNQFEVFQSIKDAPLKKCPQCSGKVRKCIGSGAGLIFKGNGFYITDYKNKKTSSGSDAAKSSESGKKENGLKTKNT
jgi:putative FmdB family regulatory protein